MRLSTTIVLLIAVGGLLFYIIGYEKNSLGTKEKLERQVRPFTFQPDDVDEIEVVTEDDRIDMMLESQGWEMKKPFEDRANPDKIKSLLESASKIEWLQTFNREDLGRGDLENSGLDDGGTLFVFKKDGKPLAHLRIGSASAIEEAIYASSDGDDKPKVLHLTRSDIKKLLPVSVAQWRDNKLLRIKADTVATLSLDTGIGTMEFERDLSTGDWNVIKPLRTRGSNERINAILASILNLDATPTQPGTPNPGDSTLPPLNVKISTTDKRDFQISFHANTDVNLPVRAEVSGRPESFQSPAKAHHFWRLQANHLRDQQLARINATAVTGLRLYSENHGEVLMTKSGENWMLKRFGEQEPANQERITQLLDRLNIEQVREFVSDSATEASLEGFGLNKPFLQISWDTAEKTTDLSFGSDSQNKIYAHYKDEPYVYRVSPLLFSVMPPEITKWRGLKVVNVSTFAVRRLTITQGVAPPLILKYQPNSADWTGDIAGNDISPKINKAAANKLLQQVVNLEASDWSADRRDAYTALRNPSLTLQLSVVPVGKPENEQEIITLLFAPTQPGKDTVIYHGRLDGDPDTFLITRDLYRELITPLIND